MRYEGEKIFIPRDKSVLKWDSSNLSKASSMHI